MGIEPSPEHPGSHDLVAIAPNGVDGKTSLKRSDFELRAPLGTRVPNKRCSDEWFAQLRRAWAALRVV